MEESRGKELEGALVVAPEGALVVEWLARRMPDFALEASFTLAPGERAALAGRSGSGKTTLLRLLAGLDEADSGRVRLGDRELTRLPARERGIGFVFQDQALFPALDVLENVAFALRMRGAGREERAREAMPWLERLGLASRARADVSILSGGERQRVALARALVWKPRLLLLDEPFSALDAETRAAARRELVELHRLCPAPLILVTHDEGDLEAVATVRLSVRSEGGLRKIERAT